MGAPPLTSKVFVAAVAIVATACVTMFDGFAYGGTITQVLPGCIVLDGQSVGILQPPFRGDPDEGAVLDRGRVVARVGNQVSGDATGFLDGEAVVAEGECAELGLTDQFVILTL